MHCGNKIVFYVNTKSFSFALQLQTKKLQTLIQIAISKWNIRPTLVCLFFSLFFNQDIQKRRPFSVCQSSNKNIYISEWFHGNNSFIVEILNETTCHILGIGYWGQQRKWYYWPFILFAPKTWVIFSPPYFLDLKGKYLLPF